MTRSSRWFAVPLALGLVAPPLGADPARDGRPLDLASLAREPGSFAGAQIAGGKAVLASEATGRKDYPRAGPLDRGYMGYPTNEDKQTVPLANAGFHGGGFELKAFTVAAWVKPGDRMPDGRRGEIAGLSARR